MNDAAAPQIDQTLARARDLVNKIWTDGDLGPKVRAKAKEMFPDISIPEEQVAPAIAPLAEENKKLREQFEALAKRIEDKDKADSDKQAQLSMEQALEKARKKYSLTDEGFEKMVARMREKGNFSDAESAAAWVASETPPPKPASGPSWAPQDLNLYGSKTANDDYKLLHTDTSAFFDKTVADILNESAAA